MGRERLDFTQHRPLPIEDGGNGRAGLLGRPFCQEQLRRIGQLRQSVFGHRKQARFIGRAKAVLNAAQNTELVLTVSFKIEDCIYHMLHHARPGNGSFLGHVTDDDDRHIALLGKVHEPARAFADLAHTAGGPVAFLAVNGLDGIDDQQARPAPFCFLQHSIQGRICLNQQARRRHTQAVGPQLNLAGRFFA